MKKHIVGNEQFENSAIDILEKAKMGVSVDYVAFHLKIAWGSARGLLLDLALSKKIEVEKTTSGLVFKSLKEA